VSLERLRASLADRYRLDRELGAGGMATVDLAQDLKHDRKVALKVLKPELAAVLGADRFVVEIKTTAVPPTLIATRRLHDRPRRWAHTMRDLTCGIAPARGS
jgi:serine/threonine protein kinase